MGEFVNNGRISCGEDGVVGIQCRKFVNSGQVTPSPTVRIMERVAVKPFAEALAAKKERENRMEMEVVDHRGHYIDYKSDDGDENRYHPRNVLGPRTDGGYKSG